MIFVWHSAKSPPCANSKLIKSEVMGAWGCSGNTFFESVINKLCIIFCIPFRLKFLRNN